MQLDGSVIGTTPLVPVTSTSPLAHVVKTGEDSAPAVPGQPNALSQHAFSFASVGRSLFSFTFSAPSALGVHTVAAVVLIGGTSTPIYAPVVSHFLVLLKGFSRSSS